MKDDLENVGGVVDGVEGEDAGTTGVNGADIRTAYYAGIARVDAGKVSGDELNTFFKGASANAIRNATNSLLTKIPVGWDDRDDTDFFEHNEESDRNI